MTDRYAVFGNPVAHSLSPELHKYFALTTKQNLTYERVLVENGKFHDIAKDFFASGGLGCNITVPCKLDAYNFADELTVYAKCAGAANTLKKLADGRILADNTDGRGLVCDLKRQNFLFKGMNLLVIGAGGAARGILKPLLDEGVSITVCNRHQEKADKLASYFASDRIRSFSMQDLQPKYDLIINASSSSLQGKLPTIEDGVIAGALEVYDLMYSKTGSTVFTEHALSLGVKACSDGFGMLIGQAVLSFELWRRVRPDFMQAIKHFSHAD